MTPYGLFLYIVAASAGVAVFGIVLLILAFVILLARGWIARNSTP